MGARALAVMAIAGSSGHCQVGFECDTHALVQRLAGSGATNCGLVDGSAQTVLQDVDDARTCMASALSLGRPFFSAMMSPASADGGTVVGYASDGATLFRVEYHLLIAVGCVGSDSESMPQARCERLLDLGNGCDTAADDLRFACENETPIEGACSR